MNFLELKEQFENKINDAFELLELHYAPYAFGSGMVVYRVKGQIIKVVYDGRDDYIELFVSSQHDKYANASWTTIYTVNMTDFLDAGLEKLFVH